MAPRITRDLGRYFLKDTIRMEVDFQRTPQNRGEAPPPLQKPHDARSVVVPLPAPAAWQGIRPLAVAEAIAGRTSRREFTAVSLTLDELAFLLWATQGLREQVNPYVAVRTVPSAGARHAFETYLGVLRVAGLAAGVYRYLPLEHALVSEFLDVDLAAKLVAAAHGQEFVGQAALTFIWSAIPARMEWRYGEASYKVMAIDAGHVCQNLYLACECIGAGTCAIAAYRQELTDSLLRLDGQDEFAVYLAPVGKVRP